MTEIAKIKTFLMEKDAEIAQFSIDIYDRFVAINSYEILNKSLLPPVIKTVGMLNWLLSRCMSYITHWQAHLFDSILQSGERNPYAPFVLSLNTNSASVTDWYWLQPTDDIDFQYFNQNIIFSQTKWDNINWFDNKQLLCSFNDHINKDVYDYDIYSCPIKTPIFTINGESQNQIILKDVAMYLKQRKPTRKIENELKCLSALNEHGIITPKVETDFIDSDSIIRNDNPERSVFDYETRQHGMYFIIKRLLTSEKCKLVPLSWFGQQINAASMTEIINNIEHSCGVCIDNKYAAKFIDQYVHENDMHGIDGSNIGFLCDEFGRMQFAAWSNIEIV